MFSTFYHAVFYDPVYNGLVFLIGIVPGGDVGVAVILLTILVRLVLFPLSLKAVRTQLIVKKLEPELARIKEQFPNNREEQAKRTMALHKENGVNLFSSFLFTVIQILFIFALYYIFWRGGLPDIRTNLLYSFISVPEQVRMTLFGILDVASKNIFLAAIAGIVQFFQTRLAVPPHPAPLPGAKPSMKNDLARSFNLQMRYALPVLIFVVSYTTSVVVALYLIVSNMVSIGQELYDGGRVGNHKN